MKKTLGILIVIALLGILAASVAPSPQQTTVSTAGDTNASTPTTTPSTQTRTTSGQYKDGSYTGELSSNRFDDIQVAIVISGGKITDITTPTLRGDSSRSTQINSYAVPQLTSQALSTQNASLDGVSGASYTTDAYIRSLQSALDQAKS